MAITIQNQLHNDSVLSPNAQIILKLIPEGASWFEQTAKSTSLSYVYQSEADFLSAVLTGLHATSLLYIPKISLLVDPQNLLNIDNSKLITFYESIQKNKPNVALQICKENGLVTKQELMAKVEPFLQKSSLSEESLFSVMTQADYLYLYDALTGSNSMFTLDSPYSKEAAKFALSMSQTIMEFCNLYSFYLLILAKSSLSKPSKTIRQQTVEHAYKVLKPYAMSMLNNPRFEGNMDDATVQKSIQTWLEYGNIIGFSSITVALLQLAIGINLNAVDESLDNQFDEYVQKINIFLHGTSISSSRLTQDCQRKIFFIKSTNMTAQLSMNKIGSLTMEKFHEL